MGTETGEGLRGRERGAFALLLAASVAIALAAIFAFDYLPTHDGPQHIYAIHAKQHLGDPGNGYARFLEAGRPLTAQGFAAIFGPFDQVLSWRDAYRAALACMLLAWIFGAAVLAHVLSPQRVWLGLALGGAGFSWSLYMGFFSFYVATAFGLWVLAFAAACDFDRATSRAGLAALLLVQGWLHIFPAALTGAVALLLCVAKSAPDARLRTLLRAVPVGLPLALLALLIVMGRGEQTELLGRDASSWQSQWTGIALGAKALLGGPAWRAFGLPLLAAALLATALLRMRARLSPCDGVLIAAGVVAAVAGFAAPLHLIGWDFFSLRFLPLALACSLLAFPLEGVDERTRGFVATVCAIVALANPLWAFDYNRELDRVAKPALQALDLPLERSGPRLAVVMDPGLAAVDDPASTAMPFAVPLLNLGQLYATAQGGFPADTFAISPATHQVLIRDDAPAFPPYPDRSFVFSLAREEAEGERSDVREKFASYAASFGAGFEDVVWFGRPEDHALLEARGFTFDHREGGLAIARFMGCPLTVDFGDPPRRELEIELGWFPLLESSGRQRVAASASGPVELIGAPCGPVWLRVRTAGEVHAGASTRSGACRGADAEGRVVLRDTRATPNVRCELDAG